MSRLAPVTLALATLALTACASGPGGPRDARRIAGAANPGEVIATERAFARMAVEKGTWTAFREYATKDALWPSSGAAPALVNVQQALKGTPDPAQPVIWGPDAAWSSCDGSFAVTTGEAQFPGGRKSRFVTVWQRQDNGEYRWVLDQGFASPGGEVSPDLIPAKVAECARGGRLYERADRRARRGEAWGSAQSDDATLAWETRIAADCSRTLTVRMAAPEGMSEVLRRAEPAPVPAAGQPAPRCAG